MNRLCSEQDQPPTSDQFKGVLLSSQCASPHSRSARPRVPHPSLRHHVPVVTSLHIMTPAPPPASTRKARVQCPWVRREPHKENHHPTSRPAAGRPWPQEWILRRPTTTILDPKSSSAASVLTDFAEQSPSPKARPVAVLAPPAPVIVWSVREGSGCRMFAGANASASRSSKQSAATCPAPQSTPSLGLSRAVFATAPPPSTAPPDKELPEARRSRAPELTPRLLRGEHVLDRC